MSRKISEWSDEELNLELRRIRWRLEKENRSKVQGPTILEELNEIDNRLKKLKGNAKILKLVKE